MERDAEIAAAVPLLAQATPLIGHFQIRNRGTVGGSLAHADPASEWCLVAVTLGAEFTPISDRGTRSIRASDWFRGLMTTALRPDELLLQRSVHVLPPR
jgi:carbon-monoxide dehydrogenase medium subunit